MPGALSLPLGINFSKFDQDLRKVADRIESAGKTASVKVGSTAGKIAEGGFSGDEIAARVSQIGERIAVGIAAGVRSAPAAILRVSAHIEAMLDKLVGSAVTIFRRIDGAIKFPKFDAFFKNAEIKLGNFANPFTKKLSQLDIALKGGFGGALQRLAKFLVSFFEQMGEQIGKRMGEAISKEITKTEARAKSLMTSVVKGPPELRFSKFPSMGTAGLKSSVPGPKIGTGTKFLAEEEKKSIQFGKVAEHSIKYAGHAMKALVVDTTRLGAALAYIPLRGYNSFRRFHGLLSTLGDVGKASYHKLFESHGLIIGSALSATKAIGGIAKAVIHIGTLGVFRKKTRDVQDFGKASIGAAGSVGRLGSIVKRVGGQIAIAFGFVGLTYKAVQFFKESIQGASALNETVNRAKTVFGSAYGPVQAQADTLSRRFKLLRNDQLTIAAGFGAMAQGAGLSEQASAGLANRLTKLAGDFSSSANLTFEEAGSKIRSALAGQSEPLRQFGANITEVAVKNYALAHGLASSTGAISEQAKIMARAELIAQGLGYAQGDLERTADSAANQFRKAGGGIQEFGTRLGEILLPAVQAATEAFNSLLEVTLSLFEGVQPYIQGFVNKVKSSFDTITFIGRNFSTLWKIVGLKIGEFAENAVRWFRTLPDNLRLMWKWMKDNWWNLLVDMGSMAKHAFWNLLENARNFGNALWEAISTGNFDFVWKNLLDGFQATAEKLPELIKPELVNVGDEVAKLWKNIEEKEKKRNDALNNAGNKAPKKPPGAIPKPDEQQRIEYRLAGAAEIGSREAYSAISRNIAGRRSTNDIMKQGLGIQKQQLGVAKEQLAALKNKPEAPALEAK